jgi:hypothetical protein
MNQDDFIVIAVRLVVPLLILRYPLVGGWTALVLDALDVALMDALGALGGDGWYNYRLLDSRLDFYYLSLMAIVAGRWRNPYARWPALALFAWRSAGVILFWLTGQQIVFFVFPNLFENWWLYCVTVERFWPRLYPHSVRSAAVPLVVLLVPKMVQELLLHVLQAQPWDWIMRNVFGMA